MTDDHRLQDEINRLYWATDRSVADIADTVGTSRRGLYDAIRPHPAGAPCPSCDGALTFRNRRSVQRGEAECASCGREHRIEPDADPRKGAAAAAGAAAATPPAAAKRRRTPVAPAAQAREPGEPGESHGTGRAEDAGRSTLIGAAALIGLAIGAVTALLLRRR